MESVIGKPPPPPPMNPMSLSEPGLFRCVGSTLGITNRSTPTRVRTRTHTRTYARTITHDHTRSHTNTRSGMLKDAGFSSISSSTSTYPFSFGKDKEVHATHKSCRVAPHDQRTKTASHSTEHDTAPYVSLPHAHRTTPDRSSSSWWARCW